MYPERLYKGDVIRIIAPSKTLSNIEKSTIDLAQKRLEDLGLKVTYGKNVYNSRKYYDSASIEQRIVDLQDAFEDSSVKAILTVVGGYNSNQLISKLDYTLIRNNPKIFCGLSDITALQNAIYSQAHLVTFSGPHFSNFGMLRGFEYTESYFKKMFLEDSDCVQIYSSKEYSSDVWYLDQDNRIFKENSGMIALQEGFAEGIIVGGNLSTFNLLKGTPYMPDIKDRILFLEDTNKLTPDYFCEFDRNLEALAQTLDGHTFKALVIGRAEDACNMSLDKWKALMFGKEYLLNIPIIVNANFGHTTPIFTFPIGGKCRIDTTRGQCSIQINKGV